MLTQKIAPRTGDSATDRVIGQIYNDINELIGFLNKATSSVASQKEGQPGEVRVIKMADNTYRVAIRHQEGWIISDTTTFTFQGKGI